MTRFGILPAFAIFAFSLFSWAPVANAQTVEACAIESPPSNCQGMWALQVDLLVPPSLQTQTTEPGCASESQDDVLRVIRAVRTTKAPELIDYSGPLLPALEGPLDATLRRRGVVGAQMLLPYHKDGVACAIVAGVIPWRSIYMGYRLLAADNHDAADFRRCEPGSDCPTGRSRFPLEPIMQRSSAISIIYAPFVNWSPDRSRKARLIVFYKMWRENHVPRTHLSQLGEVAVDTAASLQPATRRVPLQGASNFRDLGGYQTTDGKRVKWGMLYRSDALDSLTHADWRKLEALEIARITDFRAEREIRRRPDRLPPSLETRRHNLPLDYLLKEVASSAGLVTAPPARGTVSEEEVLAQIDRALMSFYPRFVRETQAAYGSWLKSLLDGSPQSAHVFHCTGGADRTGFAGAILLIALGVSKDQVMQDYLLTNQYLYSPEGRALLDRRTDGKLPDGVQVHARYLDAALKTILTDYGSFDAYLREGLGVDDATRRQLREKFLE